jgi:hypothetical protein
MPASMRIGEARVVLDLGHDRALPIDSTSESVRACAFRM